MPAVDTKFCDVVKESEFQDDLEITHSCVDASERNFIRVIGCIEEIIMEEKFSDLQNILLEKYWKEFQEEEENKLIYTDIFHEYLQTVEKYIECELMKKIPEFHMPSFENELRHRKHELDGEVFEMLLTFSDFEAFKNMFLDYKAMKEGQIADFSEAIVITKYT